MASEQPGETGRKPKLSTVIAEAIETDIIGGGWQVGTVLATEAELIDRFGVSRATVREAIGQIERRGTAAMRAGKNGGLVVTAPPFEATVRTLTTYMELADANVVDILEVRQLLEQQAANLASEHITDEEIRALRALAMKLELRTGRLEDDVHTHLEIRRLIARASHNPVLTLFIDALSFSALDVIESQIPPSDTLRETIDRTSRIKARLIEAIISYDKYEAQKLTREDVGAQIAGYRVLKLDSLARTMTPPESEKIKRPQLVAMKISQHIADGQLKPGERLGSEPELQQIYGVSRSVLREAIRMLEAYSIVRMQRGYSGGLVVSTPDPSHTIALAVRFLRSMGVEWRHLFEVREALELGAVDLAARNATPDQIALLRDAFHREMTLGEHENPIPVMTHVHKLISETSSNHVLAMINKVVIDTTTLSYSAPPSRQAAQWVHESHHAIIRALADRDPSMARRRMYSHLLLLGRFGHDLAQVFGDNYDFQAYTRAQ